MLLFARVAPAGVAWLRIVSAAIVFAAWRRPWRALRAADRVYVLTRIQLRGVALGFGLAFAAAHTSPAETRPPRLAACAATRPQILPGRLPVIRTADEGGLAKIHTEHRRAFLLQQQGGVPTQRLVRQLSA